MNFLITLLWVLVIFIAIYALYYGYLWVTRKTAAKDITAEDLQANIRKSQVVDVREHAEFNVKHILGARNIPITEFKQRYKELRKDQPIYLYDDYMNYVPRAASILKKNGFKQVYILKGGLDSWKGKIKASK